MDPIVRLVRRFDSFQQKHAFLGFPYAVIKKHGEDNGGYQAALITYYGFVSLFPLILVAVMVLQLLFHNNAHIQSDVIGDITSFFPIVGDQLKHNIHTSKTGLGLVIAILFTLYGARGGADALRFTLDNMWQIPHHRRAGFPKNILRSLGIIGTGALGLVAVVAVSGFSSVFGHALWVKIILNVLGVIGLTGILTVVFRIAASRSIAIKDTLAGSLIAAVTIQLLLTFGSILVKNQLRGFNSLYGTFAVVLGLLFWIYLLAQVIVYSIEIDTVRSLKLWPRSITPEHETEADRQAYDLYVKSARRIPEEKVLVRFQSKDQQER